MNANKFIKSNDFYPNIAMLFYRMNQPQPPSISIDFQGYLVCQIPADALKVELKIKPGGVSLPYILTSLPEQRSTEHGERHANAKYIPEGEDT